MLDVDTLSPALRDQLRRLVSAECWRKGRLDYKLHATQLKIKAAIDQAVAARSQFFYILCSRRLGKSFMLVDRAFELASSKPNARVLYLAPYGKNASEIVADIVPQILADCPDDLKPKYNNTTHEYTFPNGSIIRLKGVNGEHAQFLRGGTYDLVILDECGTMDELKSVIFDVCLPTVLTTKGLILLATTPPVTPGHFSAEFFERLAGEGRSIKFTLRDAPHIPLEEKRRTLVELGEEPEKVDAILAGKADAETTTAQREYFCEFVTDSSSAVIPEFSKVQKDVVAAVARPDFFDRYVFMDPGMKDRTGIIFAYWDFLAGKLVCEDELLLQRPNTLDIATAIKAKERELWGDAEVYLRVSDVDLRLIADLHALHGLQFQKARKEDSLGAVNLMRNMFVQRQIIINPRCENLIRQCRNAIWNKKATDFARPENEYAIDGHYDLVAALKYGCRSLNRTKNPYPGHYYAMGGKLGPQPGTWQSPKSRQKRSMGLYANTPIGRKLVKRRLP